MMASVIRGMFWFMAAVMIVATGWDEPLRYRFMSKADIAMEEQALRPAPPSREMTNWRASDNPLNRGPYVTRHGIHYATGDVEPRNGLRSGGVATGHGQSPTPTPVPRR